MKKKKFKKFRRLKRCLALASLIVAAGLFWIIGWISPVSESQIFVVTPHQTLRGMAHDLKAQHLIFSEDLFIAIAKAKQWEKHIRIGEFQIAKGASLWAIEVTLFQGAVIQHPLTFPEGLTTYQIFEVLRTAPFLCGDLPAPVPEGTLWPETYAFVRGDTMASALQKMQDFSKKKMNALQQLPNQTPLTWEQVLILASIVERETPLDSEKPIVASVFLNRLAKGMRLQTDPTVIYAITNGRGTTVNGGTGIVYSNQLKTDSPYNTYLHAGLPPGPICHPGEASIRAVLSPAKTDYLYFVANGQGGHTFAATLAEHNKNVDLWRAHVKQKLQNLSQ